MSRPTAAGGAVPAGMWAVVVTRPGGLDALEIKDAPVPVGTPGRVRIRVRVFGVNESEVTTRRGESPTRACPASRPTRTAGCGRDSGGPR